MRFLLAWRAFWGVLLNGQKARQVAAALTGKTVPRAAEPSLPAPAETRPAVVAAATKEPARPRRSEAISLLAVLQREGRLVDFLQQPLAGFSDAEIGAVVREVHRDSARALDRLFGLVPAIPKAEWDVMELAAGFDASRFKLTGQISGGAPYRGAVAHHGWQATRCEIPTWSGSDETLLVVATAEFEVRAG